MEKAKENILIKRIKAGEFDLFDHIVKRYQNGLYNFILNIVKNTDDAMDLCQETFLKAYRSISSYKGKASFSTWLYRIGYNNAINYFKKHKRISSMEIEKLNLKCQNNEYEKVEKNEIKKVINKIVEDLDTKYRTPIFLFFIENKSYKEIAEIMKIPINSVKSNIFRGKNIIKQVLQKNKKIVV
ncbi:MAG: sigma-70 family RNA polymerase sigma factor [Spirochaetales bacterium]|nr:sigma-70 family RNA polymerase sigma factor [Spirochaetales bacterium]